MRHHLFVISLFTVISGIGVIPQVAKATDYIEVNLRIEAPDKTIFDDVVYVSEDGCTIMDSTDVEHDITGPKAICALAAAADTKGFNYDIVNSDFGLYLNGVNSFSGNNNKYWSFIVDFVTASVGLADYDVTAGDEILLTYGTYPNTPLKLKVNQKQIVHDDMIVVTVKMYDDATGAFLPVNNATVEFNSTSRTTNADGQAHYKPKSKEENVVITATANGTTQSNSAVVRVYKKVKEPQPLTKTDRALMLAQATSYLISQVDTDTGLISDLQSITEWSAIALVAADVAIPEIMQTAVLDYQPTKSAGASELARHILTLEALGYDATDVTGIDYVERLKNTRSDNQFGSKAYVNDDIYAGLALLASGEDVESDAVQDALTASLSSVNDDGGVSYAVAFDKSDVDTTGAFLQLIDAAAETTTLETEVASARRGALGYLLKQQNLDGGWGYSEHGVSNSSSTALATHGLLAADQLIQRQRRNKQSAWNFFSNVQRTTGDAVGAFQYDTYSSQSSEAYNTAFVVLTLARQSLSGLKP